MPVSDDMVGESFARGWALKFGGQVAHFWIRRPGGNAARAACNSSKIVPIRLGNGQTGLFRPGDFPRCARCASGH